MKKTAFVWLILVVLGLSALVGLSAVITLIVTKNPGLYYGGHTFLNLLAVLSVGVDLCLTCYYLVKLWQQKIDILFWTNIYFGWSAFRIAFATVADVISSKGTLLGNIVELFLIIVAWFIFYRHLEKLHSPDNIKGFTTKQAFLWLGSAILTIIVVWVAYAVLASSTVSQTGLDQESRAWVDNLAPQLLKSWDPDLVLKDSSPELLQNAPDSLAMSTMMDAIRQEFGTMMSIATTTGEAGIHVNNFTLTITADYVVEADFTKGHARVFLQGIKHGDKWQILMLYVTRDPQLKWSGGKITKPL